MRHCCPIETEKSAVADHMWGQNHKILFNETQLLFSVTHYSTGIYREAIEIHKHKNSFNKKEESFKYLILGYQHLEKPLQNRS